LGREIIDNFFNDVSCKWVHNVDGGFYIDQIAAWGNVSISEAERMAMEFVCKFREADMSIDIFLTRNRKDIWISRMGKLAIVLRILAAERVHEKEGIQDERQHWYRLLAEKLTRGLNDKEDFCERFSDNRATIITFNYDRSLEYYLFGSFHSGFGLDDSDYSMIIKQMEHIPIFHLHGQVARLPWQESKKGRAVEYEEELSIPNVIEWGLLRNISVAQEAFDDESENYKEAQKAMDSARTVFFLGFAYAEENLAKLALSSLNRDASIYGTAYGMRDAERTQAKKTVERYRRTEASREISPFNFAGDEDDCMVLLRDWLD
jgi:hypothetical protein